MILYMVGQEVKKIWDLNLDETGQLTIDCNSPIASHPFACLPLY